MARCDCGTDSLRAAARRCSSTRRRRDRRPPAPTCRRGRRCAAASAATSLASAIDCLPRIDVRVGRRDANTAPAATCPAASTPDVRRRLVRGWSARDPAERSTSIGCATRDREQRHRVRQRTVRAGHVERRASCRARPRAAAGSTTRVSPAASVSSVSGDGPKNPVPTDSAAGPRATPRAAPRAAG